MHLATANEVNTDSTNASPSQPRGIPGRAFVVPFVAISVLIGVLMFLVAVRFQVIMGNLEEVRSLWPVASRALKDRYIALDADIQATGDATLLTEWKQLRSRFDESTQFDSQSRGAVEIERFLARKSLGSAHSPDREALSNLVAAEVKREKSQSDFIGWLTVNALRLKLPPIVSAEFPN